MYSTPFIFRMAHGVSAVMYPDGQAGELSVTNTQQLPRGSCQQSLWQCSACPASCPLRITCAWAEQTQAQGLQGPVPGIRAAPISPRCLGFLEVRGTHLVMVSLPRIGLRCEISFLSLHGSSVPPLWLWPSSGTNHLPWPSQSSLPFSMLPTHQFVSIS